MFGTQAQKKKQITCNKNVFFMFLKSLLSHKKVINISISFNVTIFFNSLFLVRCSLFEIKLNTIQEKLFPTKYFNSKKSVINLYEMKREEKTTNEKFLTESENFFFFCPNNFISLSSLTPLRIELDDDDGVLLYMEINLCSFSR